MGESIFHASRSAFYFAGGRKAVLFCQPMFYFFKPCRGSFASKEYVPVAVFAHFFKAVFIVIEMRFVAVRKNGKQVIKTVGIAPFNVVIGDIVPALGNTVCNAPYAFFR